MDAGEPTAAGRETKAADRLRAAANGEEAARVRSLVFDESIAANSVADLNGVITEANDAFLKLWGYPGRDEVVGKRIENFLNDPVQASAIVEVLKGAGRWEGDYTARRRDGSTFIAHGLATVVRDRAGKVVGFQSTVLDFTNRKQAERRQVLFAKVLSVLNEPLDWADAVTRIVTTIKAETGFDAVGIRLRDGDDFPYFIQDGFSADFLLTENSLLSRGGDGGLCRDIDGNVRLECTCGLVLSGQTDPENPLFTRGGSCWTNDSLPLLDLPADGDPRLHPRNRCIHDGYRSVALVPIRSAREVVGLLQLNSRKPGALTLEDVRFFEDLSESIGVALLRRQAEEALRESEERFRGAVEHTPAGYFFVDHLGRYQRVNDAWLRMHGYESADEVIGLHYSRTQPREDLEASRQNIGNLLSGDFITSEEASRLRKDFTVGYHTFCAHPVVHAGKVVGLEGFLIDTTEHRRAEAALRVSELFARSLISSMNDGFSVLDSEGVHLDVNPALCQMTGFSREELVGTGTPHPYWPPEEFERIRGAFQKTLKGEAGNWELTFMRKSGARFPVIVSPSIIKDDNGRVVNYTATVKDITERKRAEEALRTASAYSRTLIETSLDPLVTISAEGKITDVNEATIRVTGVPREGLIGTDFSQYFTEPAKAAAGYQQAFAEGMVKDYPLTLRGASGQLTDVIYNASVYRDSEGKVQGLFAAARDVTERKRAEAEREKFEAQNRQLQRSESLGRMAGAIAHHFNNQLQAVMGNLELVLDELPRMTGATEGLNEAMKAARKAAEMSGLMLTYLGQTHGNREPLDLSDVCRTNLPILQVTMPTDIALETDLPSPGPIITANANQVQQVVSNLITNAREAVAGVRNVIRLTVETISSAAISAAHRFPVDWQPQDNVFACLTVADTGCGIAENDIERLFDPFFSTKFTGRGLGLPVVLGIVRAHGGGVTVESQTGRGSIFRAFFPVSACDAVVRPDGVRQVAGPPDAEVRGGVVLLVEDEEAVRHVGASLLRRLGYSVLEARDGVEAVEVFGEHKDDVRCVLLDLTMPHMDGWETLIHLRKTRA